MLCLLSRWLSEGSDGLAVVMCLSARFGRTPAPGLSREAGPLWEECFWQGCKARKGALSAGTPRDAFEGKGPQRRPQMRLDRRLEEVVKAVGGGYCRLQMPLKRAHLASGRQWLGIGRAPWRGGGGGYLPPFQCIPARPRPQKTAQSGRGAQEWSSDFWCQTLGCVLWWRASGL